MTMCNIMLKYAAEFIHITTQLHGCTQCHMLSRHRTRDEYIGAG